jgi:hypothetical protein
MRDFSRQAGYIPRLLVHFIQKPESPGDLKAKKTGSAAASDLFRLRPAERAGEIS